MLVLSADQQPGILAAAAKLHHAVVPQCHSLCKVADGGDHAIRHPRNLEQKLMLLRSQPGPCGRILAEVKKLPQNVTELREDRDVAVCRAACLSIAHL
jgi:hypothetical protein